MRVIRFSRKQQSSSRTLTCRPLLPERQCLCHTDEQQASDSLLTSKYTNGNVPFAFTATTGNILSELFEVLYEIHTFQGIILMHKYHLLCHILVQKHKLPSNGDIFTITATSQTQQHLEQFLVREVQYNGIQHAACEPHAALLTYQCGPRCTFSNTNKRRGTRSYFMRIRTKT
jgi:hypothetical protein